MVLAADTGFLILLGTAHPRALDLWSETRTGVHVLVLSTLSIAEYIAFHIQRARLDQAEQFIQALEALDNVEIVPVSQDIAALSARYRIGLGLATVDSVILSTAVTWNCEVLLTTDSTFDHDAVNNLVPVELLA